MIDITDILKQAASNAVLALFGESFDSNTIQISPTRKEFEGDMTIVCFPFTRISKGLKPPDIGAKIGEHLLANCAEVSNFNVVQGFLNLSIADAYWHSLNDNILANPNYGQAASTGKRIVIEFSSPNTNKPLHLGHIRNILLGWSTHNLLKAAGNEVLTCKVVNDRGVHICKSMLAWQLFGNGETPATTGMKGDHLVGKYYVEFERAFQKEYAAWQLGYAANEIWNANPKSKLENPEKERALFFKDFYKNHYFNEISELGTACKKMLQDWEADDRSVRQLWETMNSWVYAGFDATYKKLGVKFDFRDYESTTYLLGKEMIDKGMQNNVFYQREDTSVWIDLTDVKLDEKIVLRSDGTAVYMTQDLGTANTRFDKYGMDGMIYVVADEQDYHFKVLFEILKRLGESYAEGLYHLSYGMVHLPTGQMKSREGTVVDADDLMQEVIDLAKAESTDRAEVAEISTEEKNEIARKIGMAALKYHILKVTPKKSMIFDPSESIDMQGTTGPYIQNAYVRTAAVGRKLVEQNVSYDFSLSNQHVILAQEKDILQIMQQYPIVIFNAARDHNPADICGYAYTLAKSYHKFYHDLKILGAETEAAKAFRIRLSQSVAQVLQHSMNILGIEMPERM